MKDIVKAIVGLALIIGAIYGFSQFIGFLATHPIVK